ncbi:hypothetical protein LOTGIDRAFT_158549 [Lottia gigantea]|uniref:Uncharacterized protein n=1 Tax=Lottia gigantea TaxID=225164 RepID=V4CC60_LOTGI|nr:hypothetical protein LOTGIDRAFT_158549 [Lottia gigantea]ESO99464.1 hypothetical protein LOTGIDRAFT_158549 [Lottia gigantea]
MDDKEDILLISQQNVKTRLVVNDRPSELPHFNLENLKTAKLKSSQDIKMNGPAEQGGTRVMIAGSSPSSPTWIGKRTKLEGLLMAMIASLTMIVLILVVILAIKSANDGLLEMSSVDVCCSQKQIS